MATIYSGTFNPIHLAHLIIAQTVKDDLMVDKITFIPAYIPPHRDDNLAEPKHRLKMLKLAIQDNPDFELNDIEFRCKMKSYSYNTINKLLEEKPELTGKINFIIGSDAFSLIDTWHETEKFARLVKFIIVPREETFDVSELFEKVKLKNFNYQVANVPLIDISSTYIRRRIKEEKSIKYLVPKSVEEYIDRKNLYKDCF